MLQFHLCQTGIPLVQESQSLRHLGTNSHSVIRWRAAWYYNHLKFTQLKCVILMHMFPLFNTFRSDISYKFIPLRMAIIIFLSWHCIYNQTRNCFLKHIFFFHKKVIFRYVEEKKIIYSFFEYKKNFAMLSSWIILCNTN